MIFGTPPIVTNGLVMHLDAGSRMSYTSGSTTWRDLSGNGNNVTLAKSGSGNLPIFSTTYQGAITFQESSSYGYTTTQNFNIQGPGTLIFTQKYNSSYPASPIAISTIGIGNGSSAAIQVGIRSSGSIWKWGGTPLLSYSTPTVGSINTIAVTFSGSNINAYVNGILNNTTSSAVNQTGSGYLIINSYTSASVLEGSNMDFYNIQIYNRVLSAQEIAQNYNALKNRFGLT